MCANNSFGTTPMCRKSSYSSNSSGSEVAFGHERISSMSTSSEDSPSFAFSSAFTNSRNAKADVKQEQQDPNEFWGIVFPQCPKNFPKNVCPTYCEVCGARATGYHYQVASCNGCKTFFRRAVLGQKKFECKKGGECKNSVRKEVRVKCRSCRFDRCVETGMNPLGILSETNPEGNAVVLGILSKRKALSDPFENRPSTSKEPFKVGTISTC
ncbi:hypothetical protein PFISCL1PPCAC_25050, partial [Pristionchus fissidentatus]